MFRFYIGCYPQIYNESQQELNNLFGFKAAHSRLNTRVT